MPEFYIRQGRKAGEAVILKARRIIVGRSQYNTLILPDDSIDSSHASLEDRGDRWVLQDLGTPGGTWLNDEEVKRPRRIFDGDVLKFGKVRVEIQGVGRAQDVKPEPIRLPPRLEPKTVQSFNSTRLYLLSSLSVLIAFGLLLAILWSRGIIFGALPDDAPPHLDILLSEPELSVAPGEKVVFVSEAQDKGGLDRIEFWSNDILEHVNHPINESVVKMQSLHQWSSDEPGTYVLSIIAYDQTGQSSQMSKVQVTVQAP